LPYYSHDKQGNPIEPRYENVIIIVMQVIAEAGGRPAETGWGSDLSSVPALGDGCETLAN
jgi:hypothetical protein